MKLRPEKCLIDWKGAKSPRFITVEFKTTIIDREYSGSFKVGDLMAYFRCRDPWASRGHRRPFRVDLYKDDYWVKTIMMDIQRVNWDQYPKVRRNWSKIYE